MNPLHPKKPRQAFAICTPIGTEGVHVEDDVVVGRWQQSLIDFYAPKVGLLAEEFMNWGDEPAEIARFVRLYAPLLLKQWEHPNRTLISPRAGEEFRFPLAVWREAKAGFRLTWEIISGGRADFHATFQGDVLVAEEGQLIYKALNLYNFMQLELALCPQERLRKCRRPGCHSPYFLAGHLRQRYCSTVCAEWAQSQSKKNWWELRGREWLKARKKRLTRRGSKLESQKSKLRKKLNQENRER